MSIQMLQMLLLEPIHFTHVAAQASITADTVAFFMQQALQQQAHEAMQQSLNAMQGMPTHNMNQGYFGKQLRCGLGCKHHTA